jgi:ATP-binding cassette subfamily C protein LapB
MNTSVGSNRDSVLDPIILAAAISTTSRLQGGVVDRMRLHESIVQNEDLICNTSLSNWNDTFKVVMSGLGVSSVDFHSNADPARLPAISWTTENGWIVVRAMTPSGDWLIELNGGVLIKKSSSVELPVARFNFNEADKNASDQPVKNLFKNAFLEHKNTFLESAFAGMLINIIALASSLFSMQVYDRVIPTQGYSTLFILALGVFIAIIFEFVLKIIRSQFVNHTIIEIDKGLSKVIFARLLNVRLDQLPGTVGTLSSQIRGYETIRSFLSASSFYLLIDAPFGILFIILIWTIGGFFVALVPLAFLLLSTVIGIAMRNQIDLHAKKATAATNLKTGLLVEIIEGAETIKAGGGAWTFLSKWIDVVYESLTHESSNRNISEKSGYFAALLQQLSYVGLVSVGAFFAAEGNLTMGSLIACSILSGRALGPIAQIPVLMTQMAHAKAALDGLEKVFALEVDNHNVERPITPEIIYGHYKLEQVRFAYSGSPQAIAIPHLNINPGEKIGVIGHIGSGKSSLLRLLTGMYQTSQGKILLDNLDIAQISQPVLADKIGYLQQEHRLFSGTLRQNILIGIPDPGDEALRNVMAKTGLLTVISNHPKGMEMQIAEGGKGLSGGQRQLLALTRLFLSNPTVWLLDEPTASMDDQIERNCIQLLKDSFKPDHTVLIVTHKPILLSLVDRLLVVANHQIVIDGPRDEVINKLQNNARQQVVG